jgi:hypothetical protein
VLAVTSAQIATGCIMARVCHTNNCPVGVASQREELRARFPGAPADLVRPRGGVPSSCMRPAPRLLHAMQCVQAMHQTHCHHACVALAVRMWQHMSAACRSALHAAPLRPLLLQWYTADLGSL